MAKKKKEEPAPVEKKYRAPIYSIKGLMLLPKEEILPPTDWDLFEAELLELLISGGGDLSSSIGVIKELWEIKKKTT